VYGMAAEFSSPFVDLAICSQEELSLSSLGESVYVPLEIEDISTGPPQRFRRREIFPSEDRIIFCAGRPQKFFDHTFLQRLIEVVSLDPAFRLIIFGPPPSTIIEAFLDINIEIEKFRVDLEGWDPLKYLETMREADLVLDTFPYGGGVVLMEAMALGLPVVSFQNRSDGLGGFEVENWNAISKFLPDDLVLKGDSLDTLAPILFILLKNDRLRLNLGGWCREIAEQNFLDPGRMVRSIETCYFALTGDVS